jgi:hypothetical protein
MIRVEAPEAPLDQWSVWAVTGTHVKKNVSNIRTCAVLRMTGNRVKSRFFCQCSKVQKWEVMTSQIQALGQMKRNDQNTA